MSICTGCLSTDCSGEYLGLRWRKKQEVRENYIVKNFILCTPNRAINRVINS
jgi:hypothetical protein